MAEGTGWVLRHRIQTTYIHSALYNHIGRLRSSDISETSVSQQRPTIWPGIYQPSTAVSNRVEHGSGRCVYWLTAVWLALTPLSVRHPESTAADHPSNKVPVNSPEGGLERCVSLEGNSPSIYMKVKRTCCLIWCRCDVPNRC
jgi:hypothetical protein